MHDRFFSCRGGEASLSVALAVGQVSPGPNGLWVVSLGFLMGGIRGSLLALLAISVPPLIVLLLDRLYRRVKHHPAVEGFVRGLSLAVVGVFIVVLLGLLYRVGLDAKSLATTLISVGLGASRRVPVIVVLALAAVAGILLH
jgi:chromate transporter